MVDRSRIQRLIARKLGVKAVFILISVHEKTVRLDHTNSGLRHFHEYMNESQTFLLHSAVYAWTHVEIDFKLSSYGVRALSEISEHQWLTRKKNQTFEFIRLYSGTEGWQKCHNVWGNPVSANVASKIFDGIHFSIFDNWKRGFELGADVQNRGRHGRQQFWSLSGQL